MSALRIIRPAVLLAWIGFVSFPGPAHAIPAPEARTLAFRLQSEGLRLYKEGKYKEAIEAFRQVVNLNLNSHMANYYYGLCLVADRQYAEAVEPLKIALDLQPDFVQGHMALGDAYLKLGDTAEARAEFLRALDLQASYAAALDGLGRVFESMGQDPQAEEQYRKSIQTNVAYVDAYTHLGDLLLRLRRQDEAIELFLKAISVKPDFSGGYSRLGMAYAQLRMYDDALAAIGKSRALAPRSPDPCVALARIYLDLDSPGRAEAAIQAALALDPHHPEAHMALADLQRARQEFEAAVEILQGIVERDLPDPNLRREARARLKSARAAVDRHRPLREAVDRSPEDPAALAALGRFLGGQGAHDAAADLLLRAADRFGAAGADPALPVHPEALRAATAARFDAALALIAARRHAEASAQFAALAAPDGAAGASADEAVRLAALLNLGVARAGLGLDEMALESFAAYRDLRPDDPQGWLYVGNSQLRLGQIRQAHTAYEGFLERDNSSADATQVKRLLRNLLTAAGAAPAPGAPAPIPPGSRTTPAPTPPDDGQGGRR